MARSSTESEYRALANTTAMLAASLGIHLSRPPILWCDHFGSYIFNIHPLFHAHTKHIEVNFHFVRDYVVEGKLLVHYLSAKDQIANIMTKALMASLYFSS